MGVPGLTRKILQENKDCYYMINDKKQIVDNNLTSTIISTKYLYIDFNSIIYDSYNYIIDDIKYNKNFGQQPLDIIDKDVDFTSTNIDKIKTQNEFEILLIDNVISKLKSNLQIISPQKMIYIAIDGPPPVAKMVQQRLRRYKKLLAKNTSIWDTSNITPGTSFMYKLDSRLKLEIMNNTLYDNNETYIILSGSSIPGEGEHKIIHDIRKRINTSDNNEMDDISIMSIDGDLLILSNNFPGKNLYIITKPPKNIQKQISTLVKYEYTEMIYISMKKFQNSFFTEIKNIFHQYIGYESSNFDNNINIGRIKRFYDVLTEDTNSDKNKYIKRFYDMLTRGNKNRYIKRFYHVIIEDTTLNLNIDDKYIQKRIMRDFIFYTLLAGDDFVKPLLKLEMRRFYTFDLLTVIYIGILNKYTQFLVDENDNVNTKFLTRIFNKLSIMENYILRSYDNLEKYKKSTPKNIEIGEWEHILYHIKNNINNEDEYKGFMVEYNKFQKGDMKIDEITRILYHNKDYMSDKEINTYSREKDDIKISSLEHIQYYDKENMTDKNAYADFMSVYKELRISNKNHKINYYKRYFHNMVDSKNNIYQTNLNYICSEYIKSLLFTFKYYVHSQPPSWRWFYPFDTSPYISDIYRLLRSITNVNYISNFQISQPLEPLQQLMVVLPPVSMILPPCLRQTMKNNISLFPIDIQLDRYLGEKEIYSEVFLPNIDLHKILRLYILCNKSLDNNERILNQITNKEFCGGHNVVIKTPDIKKVYDEVDNKVDVFADDFDEAVDDDFADEAVDDDFADEAVDDDFADEAVDDFAGFIAKDKAVDDDDFADGADDDFADGADDDFADFAGNDETVDDNFADFAGNDETVDDDFAGVMKSNARSKFDENNANRHNAITQGEHQSRGKYSRGKYSRGKYSRGKYSRDEYSRDEYSRGKYSRDEYSRGKYSRDEYSTNS